MKLNADDLAVLRDNYDKGTRDIGAPQEVRERCAALRDAIDELLTWRESAGEEQSPCKTAQR